MKKRIFSVILSIALILSILPRHVNASGVSNNNSLISGEKTVVCLADMECVDEGHYTGNMGDACIYRLDAKPFLGYSPEGYRGNTKRNGNVGIDGINYENGFEVWIARWNFGDKISWAYRTFKLDGNYSTLTGSSGIIKSANTNNYDVTAYFYSGDTLLYSFQMTPTNNEFDFTVDVTGVDELKVLVKDNIETSAGTSYALYNLFLHTSSDSNAEDKNPQEDPKGFSVEQDGWSFVNGYEGFSYPAGYSIPEERYAEVFGEAYVAAATDVNKDSYKSMMPVWGGNCYGMSVTSILFYLGKLNWEKFDALYENNFSTVNSYYSSLRWSNIFNKQIFASSDQDTEVTKLIERYQILQEGTHNGYKENDSTKSLTLTDAFLDIENPEEYRGWWTKKNTYHVNSTGTYVQTVLNRISESAEPLVIDMFSSHGGHTVVARTDKAPLKMEDGWYRVYIYDPNTPAISEDILEEYEHNLRPYYYNNLSEDRYIELNPEINQWRYQGNLMGGKSTEYWGSNADGTVRYIEYGTMKNDPSVKGFIPEYFYVYSIQNIDYPLSFNGNEPWEARWLPEQGTALFVTADSNFSVYTVDGAEICEVIDGFPLASVAGVDFAPYVGITLGKEGSNGGRLSIPYTEFLIDYSGGSDVSIIGNETVVNIATDNAIALNISMDDNEVQLSSSNNNNVSFQITDVYSPDEYTSVDLIGTLNKGDAVKLSLQEDALHIENNITGDSTLNVYSDNEENVDGQFIETLERGNQGTNIDIKDVRDNEPLTYTITVNASPSSGGTVTSGGIYNEGESVTVKANPSNGYRFVCWLEDDLEVSTSATYTFKVASDRILTAIFEQTSGGSIPPSNPAQPAPSTYLTTVIQPENGVVTVKPARVVADGKVTLMVTPDEGYVIDQVIVTGRNGKLVEVTDNHDGTFTFFMPSGGVTVTVTFKADKCDGGEGCPSRKYIDVDQSKWYHEAVDYVIEHGLMNGTGDTTFAPDSTTTRAMLVTILYRLEGKPGVTASDFIDVKAGQWYTDAVAWASANKIVEGYGNGTFGPEDPITREQMAVILYRYADYKGYDVTDSDDLSDFTDVGNISSWAAASMRWAVAEDLIEGTSTTTLTPTGDSTRAQVATILMRFCEKVRE